MGNRPKQGTSGGEPEMVTPMDSSETGGPAAPFALRLEIKHAKVSTKPEGNDPSQVRTSD
jgi:hypothetical protein